MEIYESRKILESALGQFVTREVPASRRALIILKQMESANYDVILVLNASYRIVPNKAVMGSIARHHKKLDRELRHFMRHSGIKLE